MFILHSIITSPVYSRKFIIVLFFPLVRDVVLNERNI